MYYFALFVLSVLFCFICNIRVGLRVIKYLTSHYITLHYITLHYITLHYIHYITLHYITLHYITLHYISLHYITIRGTINQLALRKVLQVSDQKITLHCNLLPLTVPSAARPTWIAARCENLEKRLRQPLVLVIFKTLVSLCLIVYFYAKSRLYLILFAFNTFCR